MSLGIVVKGKECAALAAESRMTQYTELNGQIFRVGHTDTATKLLAARPPNNFVGVLTATVATIGGRDVSDLFADFAARSLCVSRLSVADYAHSLFTWFEGAWIACPPTTDPSKFTQFIVAGFDSAARNLVMYHVKVPDQNGPVLIPSDRDYQAIGADHLVHALIGDRIKVPLSLTASKLGITVATVEATRASAQQALKPLMTKPWDCDKSAAIADCLMNHALALERLGTNYFPKCGGPIDLATVTPDFGVRFVRQKS